MASARTDRQATSRCKRLFRSAGAFCGALLLFLAISGMSNAAQEQPSPELAPRSPKIFKICHDQTYALCAVASCFVLNQVAYCKCDVEHGDSIGNRGAIAFYERCGYAVDHLRMAKPV